MTDPRNDDAGDEQRGAAVEGGLAEVVDGLVELGRTRETVTVGDVQEALGERGFGPFLLVPAIMEISPLGGIPGMPTALAVVVVVSAVQLLCGRKHFWLPSFLSRRSTSGTHVAKALRYARTPARWIDKAVHSRMRWATHEPFVHIAALLCVLLALTVPPLELVPFASSAPFVAIGLLGLGLMVHDGLVVLLASLAAVAAIAFASTAVF